MIVGLVGDKACALSNEKVSQGVGRGAVGLYLGGQIATATFAFPVYMDIAVV